METIAVTGAAGKTGRLVSQKVKQHPNYRLRALVRTEQSKAKLTAELGLLEGECQVADVTSANLTQALSGCDGLVVATSAKPQISWASMPGFLWQKYVMQQKVMPAFTFSQMPEQVDWLGQKAQFDAAKEAGLKHVVLISSMGGTQPDNTLNKIGGGNILVWKRKAEQYLVGTGLAYTILHPGGLTDAAGREKPIIFDVDDELLQREKRSISRADVAEVCVQSLAIDEAKNRSIDLINDSQGTGKVPHGTDAFRELFRTMTANCDYGIYPPP